MRFPKRTRRCHAVVWWGEAGGVEGRSPQTANSRHSVGAGRAVQVDQLAVSLITKRKARGRPYWAVENVVGARTHESLVGAVILGGFEGEE